MVGHERPPERMPSAAGDALQACRGLELLPPRADHLLRYVPLRRDRQVGVLLRLVDEMELPLVQARKS